MPDFTPRERQLLESAKRSLFRERLIRECAEAGVSPHACLINGGEIATRLMESRDDDKSKRRAVRCDSASLAARISEPSWKHIPSVS
jgi:hypothetical protein